MSADPCWLCHPGAETRSSLSQKWDCVPTSTSDSPSSLQLALTGNGRAAWGSGRPRGWGAGCWGPVCVLHNCARDPGFGHRRASGWDVDKLQDQECSRDSSSADRRHSTAGSHTAPQSAQQRGRAWGPRWRATWVCLAPGTCCLCTTRPLPLGMAHGLHCQSSWHLAWRGGQAL